MRHACGHPASRLLLRRFGHQPSGALTAPVVGTGQYSHVASPDSEPVLRAVPASCGLHCDLDHQPKPSAVPDPLNSVARQSGSQVAERPRTGLARQHGSGLERARALVPMLALVMSEALRMPGASGRVGPQGRAPAPRATGRDGAERRRLDKKSIDLFGNLAVCACYRRPRTVSRASSMPHCCSGLTRPTRSPRRLASTAPTCSTRTRVTSPRRSISGRKDAALALRDVGATSTTERGSNSSAWTITP